MDTPARAQRAVRPQTRTWTRLLSTATGHSELAESSRAKLREHLDAAEKLAEKRQTLCKIDFKPENILSDSTVDWKERLNALKIFTKSPPKYNLRSVAKALPNQITDPRSILVIHAADAIVAAAALFNVEEASAIFDACCQGISVTKKVMADARRKAALAVVFGRNEPELLSHVSAHIHHNRPAIRKLCIDALQLMLKSSQLRHANTVVCTVLEKSAADRIPDVREAAKLLLKSYAECFGLTEANSLLASLPTDINSRLSSALISTERSPSSRPTKPANNRPSIKEIMRAKKEAMRKERMIKSRTTGEDDAVVKRGIEQVDLSPNTAAAKDPKRRDLDVVAIDQENRANGLAPS